MPVPAGSSDELALWLRLTLTPGLGPASVLRLLEAFGLPEDIFAAGRGKLGAALDAPRAQALLADDPARSAQIDAALAWAQAPDHHLLTLADPAYPARLLATGDPPPLLYVRGDPARLSAPALAIVGSRHATRGGSEIAAGFGRALADQGLLIVSGLAEGIDAAAHRGALSGRAGTIAVVGTGLDQVFPSGHAALADAIAARGAIISELPLGSPPRRDHFPRRNRLIAGLALGVLVVEAARQSGSLITARHAGEFGREVMAIPGSIHSPLSKGCHQLIRQGAKLVESAEDVLAELRGLMGSAAPSARAAQPAQPAQSPQSAQPVQPAEPAESAVPGNAEAGADPLLKLLGWRPMDVDGLVARGSGGAAETAARLVELELTGQVERLADGRYLRRRNPP
ncbi:MAG: DNA-processing protein DprA [Burkholderiaceae bacterium]